MRNLIALTMMVVALLGVMSSPVQANRIGDFFDKISQDDPKQKYRDLEGIVQGQMDDQASQNTTDEKQFNWEFVEFKNIPDCSGQVHHDYVLKGLFYGAGGKSNVFRVVNGKTCEKDGHIKVQFCILTYLRKAIGGTVAEKHFRVYSWRYDLDTKKWRQTGIITHIRTWPCKKKPIKGVDWTYEDVCGECVGSNSGSGSFWDFFTK
jgi:hypothetical protein